MSWQRLAHRARRGLELVQLPNSGEDRHSVLAMCVDVEPLQYEAQSAAASAVGLGAWAREGARARIVQTLSPSNVQEHMHAHPALHNYTLNMDDLTYKRQPCKCSDFASLSLLTACTCSRVIPLAALGGT